jgi:hypothetical protein
LRLFARPRSPYDPAIGRELYEGDFEVEVFEKTIAVRFWPTRSLYTFVRFTSAREITEFGLVSPGPAIQHGSHNGRTRNYKAAEVLDMAFRLATAAANRARR